MLIKGKNLSKKQRKQVLDTFVNRNTYELPIIQFREPNESDVDWLKERAFYFIKDGSRLNKNKLHCVPHYWIDKSIKD